MNAARFVLYAAAALLPACTVISPPRYSPSVDNRLALEQYAGSRARIASISASTPISELCRLVGPLRPDNMTIAQYVENAFNAELKSARLYAANGRELHGVLDAAAFSSGFVNGRWDLGLTLTSANGAALRVHNRHAFKTGADQTVACIQTARALGDAVQDLILKAATHPGFRALLR